MANEILGKTIENLQEMAKERDIEGCEDMDEDELRRELWNIKYGKDFLPSNRGEMLDLLLLYPDKLVGEMQKMWMYYGGNRIIDALNVVSRSIYSATTEEGKEESDKYKPPGTTQALEDFANASILSIHLHIERLSYELDGINDKFLAEDYLEKYDGDVLFLVNPRVTDFPVAVKLPFKGVFSSVDLLVRLEL